MTSDRRESSKVQPAAGQIVQSATAQLSARELHLELPVNCSERTGGYFVELPCFSTKNGFAGGDLLLGIASGLHQIASVSERTTEKCVELRFSQFGNWGSCNG